MNRAERRKQRKNRIKTSSFPSIAIHEINRQILEHDEAYSLDMDAMVLWTLHIYCGFGKKRLEKFYRDMIKEHIRMRKYYEIDDTYPERLKLKDFCDVDVEALNDEFKEVIHNV